MSKVTWFGLAAAALLQMSVRLAFATPLPGTPDVGFIDPGGAVVAYSQGAGFVPQPIEYPGQVTPYSAFAGDIVFLLDPSGGNDPSNWGAVLRFFNPADPTGTLNLEATVLESIGPPNTLGGFASLSLLPNTAYIQSASCDSATCSGLLSEFGPAGAIPAGQLWEVVFFADRPNFAVPEPGTSVLLLLGAAFAVAGEYKRRAHRRR